MNARQNSERGAALLTALVLLVVLGAVSTLTLERSKQIAGSTIDQRARLLVLHAADGGLAHARHALAENHEHRGAELRIGACDVKTMVAPTADGWLVRIEAEQPASPRGGSLRVEVELSRAAGLPAVSSWSER